MAAGLMLAKKAGDTFTVVDVAADESVTRIGTDRREVRRIAGVGKAIEIDEWRGFVRQPLENEVGADESGATGDEDRIRHKGLE